MLLKFIHKIILGGGRMQHKCKVTVIDKKLYPELQAQYCADPNAGMCPCYNVGDEYIFERYGKADNFWHMGTGTLTKAAGSTGSGEFTAGSEEFPHCSEAWDAISRYIYTALQGGSIMHGWMNDDRIMIACCSDGTRPVIFKIERLDYKAVYIEGIGCEKCREKISFALKGLSQVTDVAFREDFAEIYLDKDISDETLKKAIESCGEYSVSRID